MSTSLKCEERKFHPHFDTLPGIILRSNEGTCFSVPSYTLHNTSGFFRKLLPAPRTPVLQNPADLPLLQQQPIPVDEKDCVIDRVLRMMCGLGTPRWESFDELENAFTLIEKWDAPGPMSVIRSAITAPLFLAEPLRVFAIARRFGWEEEAKLASTLTLALCLYDEEHQSQLERLSSKDLMALLWFHRRRRDEFKKQIDSAELFEIGNSDNYICRHCGEALVDNHTWRELKTRMFMEMDKRPLGDTLGGLEMEEWPEAVACWNAKCRREECGGLNYNKLVTLRDLKACVSRLSATI